MHSLAMAQDILKVALAEAEKNNTQHIKAISIRMENEHFTESDSLEFCLEAITKGTIAEGAKIEIELIERTAKCPKCAITFPVDHHSLVCPSCGSSNINMLTDEEPLQIVLKLE